MKENPAMHSSTAGLQTKDQIYDQKLEKDAVSSVTTALSSAEEETTT